MAYEELHVSETWRDEQVSVPLTTADVFQWLQEEDQFARGVHLPVSQGRKTKIETDSVRSQECQGEEYCRFCGMHVSHHPSGPSEMHQVPSIGADNATVIPTVPGFPAICVQFNSSAGLPDLPVTNVNELLLDTSSFLGGVLHRQNPAPSIPISGENFSGALSDTTDRDLLAVANPDLVHAIGSLATRWRLERLCTSTSEPGESALRLQRGTNGEEDGLASAAVLALAVQSFSRMLMKSAVAEFRRDEAGLRAVQAKGVAGASAGGRSRLRKGPGESRPRLLTPSHVVRGLLHDARTVAGCGALLLGVSPLGVALPSLASSAAAGDAEEDE